MKILALSHIFPPAIDGGSYIVYTLAKNFANIGHQVLYVSSNCTISDEFAKKSYYPAIDSSPDHLRLGVYKNLHRILKKIGLPVGPYFTLQATLNLIKTTITYKPNLIIAGPLPTSIIFYTKILSILTNAKTLFVPCYHEKDSAFDKFYFKGLLSCFDLWVFTKHEKFLLKKKSKHIFVNPPGIEPEYLKDKPTTPSKTSSHNLLFLGNFAAHKGITQLIRSMIYLPQTYTLTVAGQKTLYYPKIIETFNNLPIEIKKRVNIIPGKYSVKTAKKLLANSDLLVLPSTHESFGLVLAEAMSQKKPYLCLNLPTTAEIAKFSRGGYLLKSNNPKHTAEKILKIFKNRNNMYKKAESGYSYVQNNLDWVKITNNLCDFMHLS